MFISLLAASALVSLTLLVSIIVLMKMVPSYRAAGVNLKKVRKSNLKTYEAFDKLEPAERRRLAKQMEELEEEAVNRKVRIHSTIVGVLSSTVATFFVASVVILTSMSSWIGS